MIRTAAVSAEFGRATGAIVDVITKSGTNQFTGLVQVPLQQRRLEQAELDEERSGESGRVVRVAGRDRFDKVNKTYSGTLGGPIVTNRAWFFVRLRGRARHQPADAAQPAARQPDRELPADDEVAVPERRAARCSSRRRRTSGCKVTRSPTDGFVRNDYWPGSAASPAERESAHRAGSGRHERGRPVHDGARLELDGRGDGGLRDVVHRRDARSSAARWTTARRTSTSNDNRVYNGATFDGFVKRPRTQVERRR